MTAAAAALFFVVVVTVLLLLPWLLWKMRRVDVRLGQDFVALAVVATVFCRPDGFVFAAVVVHCSFELCMNQKIVKKLFNMPR